MRAYHISFGEQIRLSGACVEHLSRKYALPPVDEIERAVMFPLEFHDMFRLP